MRANERWTVLNAPCTWLPLLSAIPLID